MIQHAPGRARSCRPARARRRRRRRPTLVIAAALAVAGCAGADDRPSDWDYIHAAIIVPSCATAGCHGNPLALAGLDFSGRDGTWTFLTGRVCGAPDLPGEPRGNLVLPGQPERSTLMHRAGPVAQEAPLVLAPDHVGRGLADGGQASPAAPPQRGQAGHRPAPARLAVTRAAHAYSSSKRTR